MILAGDIGGTKTLLALYEQTNDNWNCYKKEVFSSSAYSKFSTLLDDFLTTEKKSQITNVCIGVAGPVLDGDCITTNLPWVLKSKEISSQLNVEQVSLLNDLEATAWGVLALPEDDFVQLNPEAKESEGNLAILAAGTGLGEALVIWSDNKHHVVATEGGHTDFAPRNKMEIGLLQYLLQAHPDHVSYERVVCGQGLVSIYQYLKSINYAAENNDISARMSKEDPASVIGQEGVLDKDKLCSKALTLFCEIYGAESGNLALKCLPKAGVVLAGGVAAKILPSMQKGDFMRGFLSKGRYVNALQKISVKVCLNPEAALLGAFNFAKNKTTKQ